MQQWIGDGRMLVGGFSLSVVPNLRVYAGLGGDALLEDFYALYKFRLKGGG